MSNYSPYNKTYRYLVYQNQAYHLKNKINASPQVRTNLRHSMSRFSPVKDPENNFEAYMYRSTRSQSTNRTSKKMNVFLCDNQIKNVIIDQPIMEIHKHKSYQKFNQARIKESNNSLVDRMIKTDCTVVKRSKALNEYEKHLRYSQIRAHYNDSGQRKDNFALGNRSLLCPTLMEFVKCGLGDSFLNNFRNGRQKRGLSRHERRGSANKCC